jgi:hypothetical protein
MGRAYKRYTKRLAALKHRLNEAGIERLNLKLHLDHDGLQHYPSQRFTLASLEPGGLLPAVRAVILRPGVLPGFKRLVQAECSDLTIEAVALKFPDLFSEIELAICRERLAHSSPDREWYERYTAAETQALHRLQERWKAEGTIIDTEEKT